MRILHMIDSFSPDRGGPPEAVRQLLKAYASEGACAEVVCLDDPRAPYLHDLPYQVHALGQSYLGRYAFSPRLWQWLNRNLSRFDAIVMNGIWTFPGVALCFAAGRADKPYGIFVHGALDPWFDRTYPLKYLKKLLYWPLQHAVLHRARAVFFTTAVERDLAKASYRPSKWTSVVVPYGIAEPKVTSDCAATQIGEFYDKVPQVRGRHFLLFMGRIHEKKGCDMLLKAFAQVHGMAPGVDLVIAGPDANDMRPGLEELARRQGIAGRVHWPGMISGDAKWGALRACDAFVLPSHQENFGVAVVEALAAGRPVLISNQVNIWPEIQNDGAGLADEDTDKGTLRLLGGWFAMKDEEKAAMANRARQCFDLRFSMRETAAVVNNALGFSQS
jgi:glycosyltransferase involved in cell wall biosynthesis